MMADGMHFGLWLVAIIMHFQAFCSFSCSFFRQLVQLADRSAVHSSQLRPPNLRREVLPGVAGGLPITLSPDVLRPSLADHSSIAAGVTA